MVQATKLTITTSHPTRVFIHSMHRHKNTLQNEAATTEISTLGKKHQVEINKTGGGCEHRKWAKDRQTDEQRDKKRVCERKEICCEQVNKNEKKDKLFAY